MAQDYTAQREGQYRRWAKYYAETPTCSNGHPWTPENTRTPKYPSPNSGKRGGRVCRECEKDRSRALRAKKKLAQG